MKKSLVLIMAILAMSNAFAAESAAKPAKLATDKEARICQHDKPDLASLNLSAEQKEQLATLRQKHRQEKQALRDKHRADMKAILTAEQWTSFEAMKPEKPFRGHKGDKGDKTRMPAKH